MKDDYAEKLTALADDVKNPGLAIRERQMVEISNLDQAIRTAQRQRQEQAVGIIKEYSDKMKRMVNDMDTELETAENTNMNEKDIKKKYLPF